MNKIPDKFLPYITGYGPQIHDCYCDEPIGWGYKIAKQMSKEDFNELGNYGEMECLYGAHLESNWYLITKWLTVEEAMERYGPMTKEERGPRGGFRKITFGKKTFSDKHLDPKRGKS